MTPSNKEKYRLICQEKPIPLFMQAWWMDAVCSENKEWDVLLYEKDNKIQGALVYHLLKKLGFKLIIQPQLTQYNGVWIDYLENMKSYQVYSHEKKVMDSLINQLEALKISLYNQSFHHTITNWQPLYWKGFEQTTKYTYRIENIADSETIYDNFCPRSKHKHISRAKNLTPDLLMKWDEFYEFHKLCLAKKGVKIEYSKNLFKKIHSESSHRNQGQIFSIKDKDGDVHCALFVVWDKDSAYNLIIAINPEHSKSGASTRVVWEAIQFLADKTKTYDFEGSMIEGVAYNDQLFGAIQTPYFSIKKYNSTLLSLILKLKS